VNEDDRAALWVSRLDDMKLDAAAAGDPLTLHHVSPIRRLLPVNGSGFG
jgi:hypothetical protein